MMEQNGKSRRRLSEEDPGCSGVDPGAQEYASGQWRGRLRTRPPRRDIPEEATASTSIQAEHRPTPQSEEDDHQPDDKEGSNSSHTGPSHVPTTQNRGRGQPWSNIEKEELLWCYYYCEEQGSTDYRKVYNLWRERNPNIRANYTANTLQTQRRNVDRTYPDTKRQEIRNAVRRSLSENARQLEHNTQLSNGEQGENLNQNETDQLEEMIKCELRKTEQTALDDRKPLRKIRKTKQVAELITRANRIILQLRVTPDLLTVNHITYAVARVVTDIIFPSKDTTNRHRTRKTPPWEHRLKKKVEQYRKELSVLTEYKRNPVRKSKGEKVAKKWLVGNGRTIEEAVEELKQRITATAQRIRRSKKRVMQYTQNKLFQNDTKKFYRSLKESINIETTPTQESVENFWRTIYSDDANHNNDAQWIKQAERRDTPRMIWTNITIEEVKEALAKSQNWKAAGIDRLPNFWLKEIHAIHPHLARAYNDLSATLNIPSWFAEGRTVLLPKATKTENPKNYRPITCLNTSYKILTSILANRISQHATTNKLIPPEQKGCSAKSRGCKDHLLLSKSLTEECRKLKKTLIIAWMDYLKAFDSIPHSWLQKACELAGVDQPTIALLKALMDTWKIKMYLYTPTGQIVTDHIKIKRGIYQGDSLSPLLFCIALFPLTDMLNTSGLGYKTLGKTVNHLLYMDDLKLFAPSMNQMKKLLDITKVFSKDIKMEFGIDKCALVAIRGGHVIETENIEVEDLEPIKSLERGTFYKYLGIEECQSLDHEGMKSKLIQEYFHRLRKILKSQLHAKNKLTAIGALAVPVIQYSFGIINWRIDELRKLDAKTRKLLTAHGVLHPRADTSRLYVPRRKGGRGLKQVESAWEIEIYNLAIYVIKESSRNHLMNIYFEHDKSYKNYSITKQALKTATSLCPDEEQVITLETLPPPDQTKRKILEHLETEWKNKNLHGQLLRDLANINYDNQMSFSWLTDGNIKPETESLLTAAQDQALKTRYIEKRIHHSRNDELCRLCKGKSETVVHIMSACPILALKEYVDRHNKVCNQIHFVLCRHFGCNITADKWYKHQPEKVTLSNDRNTTILFDHPIRTDRVMTNQSEYSGPANRPDIVVRGDKETLIIDVSIPADVNIIRKEAEKNLKYQSLAIEIKRMWRTKVVIIPIIIGCTGFVSRDYQQLVDKLPGEHNARELQKTAVLGTAHILRKVLS